MIAQLLLILVTTLSVNGRVSVDGSSTVYPITEAIAEAYAEKEPKVRVTVGVSGTGGGFKRFAAKEIDIADASRPIKEKESKLCKEAGISYIELPIAYDGLTVVINKKNDWVDFLTVDELKKIFLEESSAMKWSDVREGWPDEPIKIYSPGTDSGTFDYFKEVIAGKKGSIRSDMSVSEDDNVLVKGVSGGKTSIGFFGCAYYYENTSRLKAVPIMNPKLKKAIFPTKKAIEDGTYAPFSRHLYIYVNKKALRRPEVLDFVRFYLDKCPELSAEVGYVQLPNQMYVDVKRRITGH